MDVVALVPARDHASTRYRVLQFGRHLDGVGLRLRIEPIERSLTRRIAQIGRPRFGQVVLLQRKLLPVWQLTLLRQRCRMLLYDFDDAVFYRDSFHRRGRNSLTRLVRFHATCRLADRILAGNGYLADYATKAAGTPKVDVVPTCVDTGRYVPARHEPRAPTRLVWIGSTSTLPSLIQARETLEQIGRALPGTRLRVICDSFPRFEHLSVERAPWSADREPDDLRTSDIGISTLPDDWWSRGKCGLKVLQYMAAGLPVVASPVGVHPEMLPGDFLPHSTGEWVDTIGRLTEDHRLRTRVGSEVRRSVENRFGVDRWGPVVADRLREAASCV